MAIIVVHSLSVLEESDSTTSNAGLGHAWLLKSQVLLAKIDREEEITASDLRSRRAVSAGKKAKRDNPLHSADYVEARGTLLPSTEYFSRVVTAAEKKHELTGELLVLVSHVNCYFIHGSL